jgi:hypothetical protein
MKMMVMNVFFDTQELVNELKNNGFTLEQSEAVISVIKKAQHELATKQDVVLLQRDIKELGKDLTIRLGGIIFVAFGLFSGLLAYIVK